jgi:hypothetical protein
MEGSLWQRNWNAKKERERERNKQTNKMVMGIGEGTRHKTFPKSEIFPPCKVSSK